MRTAIAIAISTNKGVILGGGLGLLIAGFWGLVVGASFGLAFDQWERFLLQIRTRPKPPPPLLSSESTLVLALTAYARALDLPGFKYAVGALQIIKSYFVLDHETLRYIGKIIMQSEDHSGDYPSIVHGLKVACGEDMVRKKKALSCLLDLAKGAENTIDATSFGAIEKLAQALGISEAWATMKPTYQLQTMNDDPHAVLGLSPQATLESITQVYRDLMQQTHPDRWAGVNNSFTRARLQERAARINAAYERLKKHRG
jgi:hypothetical protein